MATMSKVFRAGDELAIHIPQGIVKQLGFTEGSEVEVTISPENQRILDKIAALELSGIDPEFMRHIDDFIERYRPALKALAKR